jgi:hypothetical protein
VEGVIHSIMEVGLEGNTEKTYVDVLLPECWAKS